MSNSLIIKKSFIHGKCGCNKKFLGRIYIKDREGYS